jgi:hypothetical protein
MIFLSTYSVYLLSCIYCIKAKVYRDYPLLTAITPNQEMGNMKEINPIYSAKRNATTHQRRGYYGI